MSEQDLDTPIESEQRLDRIPIREGRDVWLLPVGRITSIVAKGHLLHISTVDHQRHTIAHRLKELEARLDTTRFVRIGRGTLVNLDMIVRVTLTSSGTHVAVLADGHEIQVSRRHGRSFRERFLTL